MTTLALALGWLGTPMHADDVTLHWSAERPDGNQLCLVTETAQLSRRDTETPFPGETFVYMVRPANACGVGDWGSGTNGEVRTTICP